MSLGQEAYASPVRANGGTFQDYYGPSAASSGPDRIDLFASADAGSLLHRFYQDGQGWSGWETVSPSQPGRDPRSHVPRWWSCSWGQDRFDVFGVKNGHLEHLWYQGGVDGPGWGDYDDLGGDGLTQYLAVAAPSPGRLDVMGIDEAGAIQHLAFGPAGWSTWSAVDKLGTVANPLMFAAASSENGVTSLFTVLAEPEGQLCRAKHSPDNGWQVWEILGAGPAPLNLNMGLTAAAVGNRMWLFGMADERVLSYTRELPLAQREHPIRWAPWTLLAPVTRVGSACRRGTSMHVFGSIDGHPANVYFQVGTGDPRDEMDPDHPVPDYPAEPPH